MRLRLLHGQARNIRCWRMTFIAVLFVLESDRCYSLLLVCLSPFLCYISFVQFIPKINDPLIPGHTVLGAGTMAGADGHFLVVSRLEGERWRPGDTRHGPVHS